MPVDQSSSKVSPELAAQLDAADGPVGAAFCLAPPAGGERRSRDPDDVEGAVLKILDRAVRHVGAKPDRTTIQRNLGTFTVTGDAAIIRALIDDPAISKAIPTRVKEDVLIRPVKETPVRTKRAKKRGG